MKFVRPVLFREALQRLGERTVVAAGLDSHDWAFRVPVALRERAFFSSRIESAQFLQRTKNLLTDWMSSAREEVITPDGTVTTALKVGSREQFIQQAREFAQAEGLPVAPKDKGGLKDITARKRLGLIFDVQTQSAHDYGYWQQGNDPILLDEFPAQRFVREAQVKQKRALHEQNEGVVRLKSDLDFWIQMNSPSIGGFGVPYGPWGFNSGMGVEDVDRDEAERLGLIAQGERIPNPEAEFNDRLRASTQNLDPDVQAYLRDAFGDQVTIRDGAATWTGTTPSATPAPRPSARPATPRPDTSTTPAAPEPPPRTASTPPVSRAVDLPARGKTRQVAAAALALIDRVHSDGKLDTFPIQPIAGGKRRKTLGLTRRTLAGKIDLVGVNADGPWPELTIAHEIGHVLDWAVLGAGREFGSESAGSVLSAVMEAIAKSKAVARLRLLASTSPDDVLVDHVTNYLLSKRELWARAYAQYIATRSGSELLAKQLAKRIASMGPQQWDAEDFAEIAAAIDAAFRTLRWIAA